MRRCGEKHKRQGIVRLAGDPLPALMSNDDAGIQFPPTTFYGWITPTETFTPVVGMPVIAEIDGVECGRGAVHQLEGHLAYSVQVSAEDVFGSSNGCGLDDRTVVFRVGPWEMDHDRTWDNTRAWNHPLSIARGMKVDFKVFLPSMATSLP